MTLWRHQLSGPTDPARDAGWVDPPARKGFFTDTSICIGCKACEVACKEWNQLPMDGLALTGASYDNSVGLGASTWRHVAFVEQKDGPDFRWLIASDVCKHCTHAACLDVCPTGSLFRSEFGTVVVQDEICNGCGYCVAACPFGVIERREEAGEGTISGVARAGSGASAATRAEIGIAAKCTLCYDRLRVGAAPACAQACPTTSIQFGELEELRRRAADRVAALHELGYSEARLYGADPDDGVGGTGSIFLLLDEPEVYGLPPDPVVTTADLPDIFRKAGYAGLVMLAGAALSFLGRRDA